MSSFFFRSWLRVALRGTGLALSIAACGGGVVVEPIGGGGGDRATDETSPKPGAPTPPTNPNAPPPPKAPIGPYTGLVATTDVSILYPLPLKGESTDFVRPSEVGAYGALLAQLDFTSARRAGLFALERTNTVPPSGYAQLALVSLRLDHCSRRNGPSLCTTEARAVFQAIYERTTPGQPDEDGDMTLGTAATDGALHVTYDVPEAELLLMMKQILTLKAAEGGLGLQVLGPHPILAKQGLGGGFAKGLRAIVLEHLGSNRIGRITVFDHNPDPDIDGWLFSIADKNGTTFTERKIPGLNETEELISGSSAHTGMLVQTTAEFRRPPADSVAALVVGSRQRPELAVPPGPELRLAFDAAHRVQNPTLVNAETTTCANCHLAEGARLIGESAYALKTTNAFTSPRPLDYTSERVSVTNLHAFGYLHRKVSIMQRTANESVVVADAMEQKVK